MRIHEWRELKGWGMVLRWIEHPQDYEHSSPAKCAPVNRVGQKKRVGEKRYKLSMVACQQFKLSPGGAQQLTCWMGFNGGMSAIQIKPRRHTATHFLDGISWQHVRICLPIILKNSYIFPLVICTIRTLSHELIGRPTYWISRLNLITNIGSWYLHPEISVVTIFPGSGRSGLLHNTSQLQSWHQDMYPTYIPENRNVQTKMQPCKSNPPLFIWALISLQCKWKYTIVEVCMKMYLK